MQILETPTASEALREALESSASFRVIHERLLRLLQRNEDEEEQDFPTAYAYETALTLLLDTQLHTKNLPPPSVTADETGGLRLQWLGLKRQVRLIIPASREGREYLYFETNDSYDLEDKPSPTALAQRLDWFLEQEG